MTVFLRPRVVSCSDCRLPANCGLTTTPCQIPIVQHVSNWIINTASEIIPPGARNVINDVATAYNTGKSFVDDCKRAADGICGGLFGWI